MRHTQRTREPRRVEPGGTVYALPHTIGPNGLVQYGRVLYRAHCTVSYSTDAHCAVRTVLPFTVRVRVPHRWVWRTSRAPVLICPSARHLETVRERAAGVRTDPPPRTVRVQTIQRSAECAAAGLPIRSSYPLAVVTSRGKVPRTPPVGDHASAQTSRSCEEYRPSVIVVARVVPAGPKVLWPAPADSRARFTDADYRTT